MNNISIFETMHPDYKIDKPIRLIELFAGVGSQAMALRNLVADFEHYKVVEFDKYAIASYNAIHGTAFETMDITKVKGEDLEIVNTDSFTYLLTYSFPCQDLSVAGKMQGMTKGDNTRSGLLWEVERLLNEVENLPQVLLMENVPQVVGRKNIEDFHLWQQFLEEKGYSNFVDTLNAKNYGVAQNRNRTFMVSILGQWNYNFPKQIPLTKTMKDYLEDEVDEKYYINNGKVEQLLKNLKGKIDLKAQVIGTCHERNDLSFATRNRVYNENCNAPTLSATMYKDAPKVLQIGNVMPGTNRENPNQGRVYDKNQLAPTISCMGGGNREPMIIEDFYKNRELRVYDETAPTIRAEREGLKVMVASRGRNKENPSDRTPGAELEQRLEPNSEGICNALTSVQKDNLVLEPSIKIKQATKEGYIDCKLGGVADLSYPTSKTRRGRVQDNGDTCPTLTAAETGVCRIESQYRIRKLTPKECWRLMSFTDEDFHKAEQVNSNTQLYKQAGNSIVVKVLEAIFKQML